MCANLFHDNNDQHNDSSLALFSTLRREIQIHGRLKGETAWVRVSARDTDDEEQDVAARQGLEVHCASEIRSWRRMMGRSRWSRCSMRK